MRAKVLGRFYTEKELAAALNAATEAKALKIENAELKAAIKQLEAALKDVHDIIG